MKRYRLLKDTPTIKAGTIFEEVVSDFDKLKELVRITPIGTKTVPQWTIQDINNFNEWFEEIEEMEWRPKMYQEYWYVTNYGTTSNTHWHDEGVDHDRYNIGNCYRTKEDCEYAQRVQIAQTKIKRSSDFVPDWNDKKQEKWCVVYDYQKKRLGAYVFFCIDQGAIVSYETVEDAEQAIEDLEPEYLLHFGVEEGN